MKFILFRDDVSEFLYVYFVMFIVLEKRYDLKNFFYIYCEER